MDISRKITWERIKQEGKEYWKLHISMSRISSFWTDLDVAFSADKGCKTCSYCDKSIAWCDYMELPCLYNPVTNLYGMACGGGVPESGEEVL